MVIRALIQMVCASAMVFGTACGPASPEVAAPVLPATGGPAAIAPVAPSGSASTAASATPAAKSAVGLDAPDNDPALVETARAALACFDKAECEARGKWYQPFHSGKQADVKTLVNFLEDERPAIRKMGAGVLRGKKGQPGFHADVGLSTRVLDALEREKDEEVGREIALAAGFIDARATGLEARMVKLMRSEPRERVRAELVGTVTYGNWDNPTIVAALKELVNGASEKVGVEAVRALAVPELRAQACPFWLANVGHPNTYLADKCLFEMVSSGCKANYDAMMDAAEKRPPLSPENLEVLCIQGGTPDAVKKRLVAATEKWAMNTALSGSQRVQALKVLARCEPAQAKKAAAALAKDSDDYVREKAAEVEKAPAKP